MSDQNTIEIARRNTWDNLKTLDAEQNRKNNLDNLIASKIHKINDIPIDLKQTYTEKISQGKKLWKDKRVIICGLARNCEDKIHNNIEEINELSKHFKDYRIVVLENNSSDNTKDAIDQHIEKNNKIIRIGTDDSEDFSKGLSEDRIIRMSKYRSELQKYIKNKYKDYDYVIILDFDVIVWSIEGVLTSLAWHDFDVMGSVSLQFDVYSNSYTGWTHYDRWAFKFHSWSEEFSIDQSDSMMWFNYWKPPIGAKPIPCLSVFGGLAIYKMEAYLAGEYGHRHSEEIGGETTVEHAQFHYTMMKKGYDRVYINPSQRSIMNIIKY
jgi:hypothetical protein